ncbi:polysaccharide pyruvyl transferase family protein [Methanobacterium sp. SMA-27]|uniref:polysaccharide pyruvyl transferase family protein n=1 Tax=Methanobacterium sp. SMA-27 TaxID=1495336 RepID=UPI000B1BA2E1|nr:polysaccharide pyruvyl transferase family protein [Methanobacterium sp. SMA-27]
MYISKMEITPKKKGIENKGVDSKLKFNTYTKGENPDKIIRKVMLMGYNGANNTGSETRLISIIEDVRKVLGPDVQITIPTLNEENLRRYIKEDSNLIIAPIPSIFFFAIRKLVKEQDLVLLVEGSCYMDTWTSALLWAFLWTTKCANSFNIPCIAYAVDAGDLSVFNKFLVKREASKTDLIITRTSYAADELIKIGVTAPIKHTADSAFTFQTEPEDYNTIKKNWNIETSFETTDDIVGIAVIDFNLWPVVIRPWGRKENLYKWPYYFSRSPKRILASKDLAYKWAAEADRIIETHRKNIAFICMEELDEPLAKNIVNDMKHPQNARIFSSSEFNASQITEILRNVDFLVTSRYHAAVLSLEARIPQIAVGHDPRLKGLYKDLELDEDYLIDYISERNSINIWNLLSNSIDDLIKNPRKNYDKINKGFVEHLAKSKKNRVILKEFLDKKGWDVES